MISENERHYAEMVIGVIDTVECPMLMCEGEKMIVRKALKAYIESNDKADTPQTESQRNSEKVKGTPQTERQRLEGKRWTDTLTYTEKKCMLDALDIDDAPQTDLLVKTPQKSRDSHEVDTPQTECRTCKWALVSWTSHHCDDCEAHSKYEPQTDCGWGKPND